MRVAAVVAGGRNVAKFVGHPAYVVRPAVAAERALAAEFAEIVVELAAEFVPGPALAPVVWQVVSYVAVVTIRRPRSHLKTAAGHQGGLASVKNERSKH